MNAVGAAAPCGAPPTQPMVRYIVRRVLWVVVLLFLVSAVTFVIFYSLPSADPAALRAGRQPDPQLVETIRHNLGLDQPVYVQYWRYMKGVVLHFDFGYSYQNSAPVREQIVDRLPATISLAARRGRHLAGRGVPGRDPLGPAAASAARTGSPWARRSSRSRRRSTGSGLVVALPVRRGHRQVPAVRRRRQLRAAERGPVAVVRVADPALVRARGDLRRLLRAAAARQPDRDDVRGLHPHRARQGADASGGSSCATACASAITPIVTRARPRHRDPARRGDPHRDGLQHPRHRPARPTTRSSARTSRSSRAPCCSGRSSSCSRTSSSTSPTPSSTRGCATGEPRPLLDVEDLRVHFRTEDGVVKAVDGISYSVDRGQALGIVGESGSGKSVSDAHDHGPHARSQSARISGRCGFEGRDLLTPRNEELRRVRGDDIAMIFQDPLSSLHPFYKVGRQLVEAIRAHRDVSKAAGARARDRAARPRGDPRAAPAGRRLPARVLRAACASAR